MTVDFVNMGSKESKRYQSNFNSTMNAMRRKRSQ